MGDNQSDATGRETRRTLGLLALVTVAGLAPFLDKAFCIDDPLFLWAAEHIQANPLDFFGFDVNWNGKLEPMYDVTKNPPLACYYVALAAWVAGWSEPALHGAFLLPAIGTIWGTWFLARSLCRNPLGAALATLACPVFLVSSTNVMCDTLALCWWVWALVCWIRGLDSSNVFWLALAALLIGASALTKYFGISLIPLIAVYTLVRDPRSAGKLTWLLVPLVLLGLYQWWSHAQYGIGLLSEAAVFASDSRRSFGGHLWVEVLAILCFTGGCLIPVAFCGPWLLPRWGLAPFALVALIIGGMVFLGVPEELFVLKLSPHLSLMTAIQAGLLAAAGVLVLWLAAADGFSRRSADAMLLGLWVLGTVVFAGFVNWTCNGRSVLPMAPAIGVLMMRRLEDVRYEGTRWSRRWMWSLVPAASVAVMVAWADYRLANSARDATTQIMQFCRLQPRPVWFEGHWGFQYYMQKAGGRPFDIRKRVARSHDWMVIPAKNAGVRMVAEDEAETVREVWVPSCSFLTTIDHNSGAGFYASHFGPLPFAFGSFPDELYGIKRFTFDLSTPE